MAQGYYRFPTLHGDRVVFTCEDDLWSVPVSGGTAQRLTASAAPVGRAFFSPDGKTLAYTGREEGPSEACVMPSEGGPFTRLTHLGAATNVEGWHPDGKRIVVSSNAGQPIGRIRELWLVSATRATLPERIPFGPASSIAWGPKRMVVLARRGGDPARWKRYRGGTAGELLIDRKGDGDFSPLVSFPSNLASPMWVGDLIYFLSDHEGIGNLYSCTPHGKDVRRRTDCGEFYLRHPSTDGKRIVYHAGADLFLLDPKSGKNRKIEIRWNSPRTALGRKFAPADRFLDGAALHPKGHAVALTARGQLFSMSLWEGAALRHPGEEGARARLARWLPDGQRVVSIGEESGEERLQVTRADGSVPPLFLDRVDIGQAHFLQVHPKADLVALGNHRMELLLVDLAKRKCVVADRSECHRVFEGVWSPDGRYFAYTWGETAQTLVIKVYDTKTRKARAITRPVLGDLMPAFDPDGKYLYFLGARDLDPVYDHLQFDLNFPRGLRPYLVTLRKDVPSPFVPLPRAPGEKPEEKKIEPVGNKPPKPAARAFEIDFDGIEQRVLAFPVPLGRYGQIAGLPGGRVLFTSFPVEGSLDRGFFSDDGAPKGTLEMYEFEKLEKQVLCGGIGGFSLTTDGRTMLLSCGKRLRVLRAGDKPNDAAEKEGAGRKSGWLDLGRLKISIDPLSEWRQIYREAWRLQRDHFWTKDMSRIDWERVYRRYLPLLERLGSRGELSDLLWEMQGELGTSHAYEFGGDYRPQPDWGQGHLGADFSWDAKAKGFRVTRLVTGDSWKPEADSPLHAPGIDVKQGDVLVSIGGKALGQDCTPGRMLVGQAGGEVSLGFLSGGKRRHVTVKTLRSEEGARYREWVEANRARVHRETKGRVGYVHIPDMGPRGFAEFHRLYLSEFDKGGLIVDVRYNGGGHVSQLLLEKLARRRIGYDLPRWGRPEPYPSYAVAGPMVALTNAEAGSDGDIFSHCFKLMKLGKLIGKRTWGGVIGISPRSRFVDGGLATQPEYSFWFQDVGWKVENYGTEPDIDVDISPRDWARGRDPQMEKALEIILAEMKSRPPVRPDFAGRPSLALPKWPPK